MMVEFAALSQISNINRLVFRNPPNFFFRDFRRLINYLGENGIVTVTLSFSCLMHSPDVFMRGRSKVPQTEGSL